MEHEVLSQQEVEPKAKEPVVLNVYKVNYTKVKLAKGDEDKWVRTGAGVDGSITVVAESTVAAGDIAQAELGGEGVDLNVHAVHEVAKNVKLPKQETKYERREEVDDK